MRFCRGLHLADSGLTPQNRFHVLQSNTSGLAQTLTRPMNQLALSSLIFLSSAGCFAVFAYFTIFWLRRSSWENLDGVVVGHVKSDSIDTNCEHDVIEVEAEGKQWRFTSWMASYPRTKSGTRIKVLRKPDSEDFIELTTAGVILPTLVPLIGGMLLFWVGINMSWDEPDKKAEAGQFGGGTER